MMVNMNKHELNKYAITLAEKAFQERGFKIEDSPLSTGEVNFLAVSNSGGTMKIKVKSVSQLGSYIFIEKRRFKIEDPEVYMVVLYIPQEDDEKIIYLIPAAEWGISFSKKAKEAMQPYRFTKWDKVEKEIASKLDANFLQDENYEKLLGYISYFGNNTKFFVVDGGKKRHDNVIEIPFYDYDEGFLSFIDEFYKTNLSEQNYLEIIQPYLDKRRDFNKLIKSADVALLRTIFTYCVRGERFCDGFWVGAIENKTFLNILNRLREVL